MLGKKSKPVIEKLTGTPISGTGARLVDGATSPRSPLEFKTQSPRGLKIYDLGGVGLGIVAALEKTGDFRGEIQANKALYSMNLNRSKPIPVNSGHKSARFPGGVEKMDLDLMEEYTFVTCRGPDSKNYTRIYCDGGENGRKVNDKAMIDRRRSIKSNRASVFDISPAKSGDFSAYPASDFLSSCHLCRKNLHGRDIYMYRGEKAFCSSECRYRQIVMDEHKEKCSSEASRSVDVSTSPYTSDQMIPTGILAI